jgi:hypothetical protein
MKISRKIKSVILVLLVGLYPVIFLYSHNADIILVRNVLLPAAGAVLIAGLAYAIFLIFQKRAVLASLSASVFLLIFFTYGLLYQFLIKRDIVQVDHYLLIPPVLVAAGYAGYFLSFVKKKTLASIQNIALLLLGGLILFNIATAVPIEIEKARLKKANPQVVQAAAPDTGQKRPNIYYIVVDEYAGFDSMKAYWHSNHMDALQTFLNDNHFILTNSTSRTIETVEEMGSRLNLKQYNNTLGYFEMEKKIVECKVCQVLKGYGYTTVVFNPLFGPAFAVDKEFRYDDPAIIGEMGAGIDSFAQMVLDQTMLSAFANYYKAKDNETLRFRNMTLYSLKYTPAPPDVPAPMFVYTHLLIVHTPLVFTENGGLLDPAHKLDWNYYLAAHKYATKELQAMLETILKNADPDNPPVIILQSDHGARNLKLKVTGSKILENYPDAFQHNVVNAMYLPGMDPSEIPADMDLTDTFAIVLNHYFNAGVTIDRSDLEK